MAYDPVLRLLTELGSSDPYQRGRAAAELRSARDARAIPALLVALEDDETYLDDFPGWDEPIQWSHRPSSPPSVFVWTEAAGALAATGAEGLAAFLRQLAAAGPALRAKLISRCAAFGDAIEPALLDFLATEDAAPALAALSHLEDLRQGLGMRAFESIAARFMRLEPLKAAPGLAGPAATLQKKLSEQLWSWSRRRAAVEGAWLALGLEPWLAAQPPDPDRWNRLGPWLCAPGAKAIPKLAEALLESPEPERWAVAEQRVRWHLGDFRQAALASPPLWAWLSTGFAGLQRQVSSVHAPWRVALAAVLAGDAAAGEAVLATTRADRFDSRAESEAQAAIAGHFEASPALRGPLVDALVETLRWQEARRASLQVRTLIQLGLAHPDAVVGPCAAMLAQAKEPSSLVEVLSELGPLAAAAAPALAALRDATADATLEAKAALALQKVNGPAGSSPPPRG